MAKRATYGQMEKQVLTERPLASESEVMAEVTRRTAADGRAASNSKR